MLHGSRGRRVNTNSALKVSELDVYYRDFQALWQVSMEAKEGEIIAIIGANGAGKSTLLKTISGLLMPKQGTIQLFGENIEGLPPHHTVPKGMALVPEGRGIFPRLSVYENLIMAARGGDQEGEWNLESIYNLFPILRKRAKFKGSLLSGGEQQMLTIARALMTNPSLLLMDEPSEGLAPLIVQEIGATIGHLKERRMSILLVEQNLYMALDLADYVYILSKGVIAYESTPGELEANEEIKESYLGVSGH